jgi:AsmA protein
VKKSTKNLRAGFSVLLLAFVIAIVTILLVIDPNGYKTDIAILLKDKTGRDVVFEGAIKLSVFPWLGLSAEKIVIKNRPGFQDRPFITADKSDIKVKLLPLLTQKIEVDTIVLEGLTVNLIKDKQGANSWSEPDLSSHPAPQAATAGSDTQSKAKSALAALTVGGINIQNARINWDNRQTGERLEFKDIHFTADKFVFGKPVKIGLVAEISSQHLKSPGTVKWLTELRVDEKLENFMFNDNHIELLGFKNITPDPTLVSTITAAKAALNLTQQTLTLSDLQIKSGDIKLSAEINADHIMGKPSLQGPVNIAPFNPSSAMKQWGITIPTMSDTKALTNLAMTVNVQATPDLAEFTDVDLTLDNSHSKGSLTIKDFAQPAILFDLAMDTLDVDRYLAPNKSSKTITSPGMALAVGTLSLSLEGLRKLNADGKLALGKLTVNRMTMQDMHLTVNSKKGIVKIGQNTKQFYQGSYSSNLDVDVRLNKSSLAMNEKLTSIRIDQLLEDTKGEAKVGGVVTASTQLHGQAKNTEELRSTLAGQANFLLRSGYIKGFNLEKMLANSKNLVKGKPLTTDALHDQTAFSEISGTATLNKGLLQNNDLVANTATLRITGKGNANLDTEQLDYNIIAKLLKVEATGGTPGQVHDTPIGIHVGGTFSQPTCTLDVAALLTDKNKAKIDRFLDKNKDKIDKLMDKLDKRLGPGTSDLLKKIF